MHLKRVIQSITFATLIVAVAISVYLFIQYSFPGKDITSAALKIGYFGIFLFAFLLDISFQLIGPDVLLLAGAVSNFNMIYVTLAICLGTSLAGFVGYSIGKVYGEPALKFFMNEKRYERLKILFKKYGKFTMTILAISPLPYFPILGGIFQLTPRAFIWYALIPRILRFIAGAYIITLII